MQLLLVRVIVVAVLFNLAAQHSRADGSSQKGLTAALQKFTLPEIPDDIEQKLRDYVPNDLKRRRDEGNSRSTAEWEKITTREEWEAFRQEKVKLLRESLGLSFRKADWKPPQLIGAAEVSGTIKGEGYRIDKMLYRSSYGPWISANLYVPEPAREKMPGFIISHAHHTPKENGELQDMGVMWARAGCYVLVPDHLGHGERRQHLFKSKDDYDKPFQVSRQDYYFRYDVNLQLNLVGESLMGCLALDLMTGVSLLHAMPGIDKDKIILLGAVAGGGDPCAVTAALDERITCAAPFNFGGPQPETRYPLPEGVDFNYGGSGGWESTRNLAYSYRDGTLPWVIVGSIAPRRLIYAHEFAWDREHDPVWKRFEKIYGWYDKPDHLSFAHGHGTLTSKDPPGSHCTHIGKTHRKQMHEALAKWFDIKLPGGEESTDRHDAAELRCWTEEAKNKLPHVALTTPLQAHWKPLEDGSTGEELTASQRMNVDWQSEPQDFGVATIRQFVLAGKTRLLPILLLEPKSAPTKNKHAMIVITRAGKQAFLRERASMIAQLLADGITIALPDFYGTGLTGSSDFGRRSSATGRASTLAMFGTHLSNEHLQDAGDALDWLDRAQGWNSNERIGCWCDSLIAPREWTAIRTVPRDDDGSLPQGPDPLPELVARKYTFPVIYVRGGVGPWKSALEQQQILLPQDTFPLPGKSQIASQWRKSMDDDKFLVRRDEVVDALNRLMPAESGDHDPQTAATWIVKQLKANQK